MQALLKEEEETPQISYSGLFGNRKRDAFDASSLNDLWRKSFNEDVNRKPASENYFHNWLSGCTLKVSLEDLVLRHTNVDICDYESYLTIDPKIYEKALARYVSLAGSVVPIPTQHIHVDLETQFNELVEKWIEETGGESSLSNITSNINYLRIISLGKGVVPLIIEQLKIKPAPWFVALRAITGELNVGKEHSGNFRKIAQAWIEWCSQNGYNS